MAAFIASHLHYPPAAWEGRIGGTVVVRLSISHLGQVIKTEVLKGIGHGCDEEAARVAALLQFKVHKPRNLKVTHFRNINIHFNAPPPPAEIHYTVTSTNESQKPTGGYAYTITITKK